MKKVWNHLDKYRLKQGYYSSCPGDKFGGFQIPCGIVMLSVIATDGDWKASDVGQEYSWQHVSVSLPDRSPTWEEMDYIKNLFWEPDEVVMQLHVGRKDHINIHNFCLHLWKPNPDLNKEIPLPPKGAV